MVRALLPLAAVVFCLSLGGCGTGPIWGRERDPEAAISLQQAEPLVAECRRHFIEDLKETVMRMDSGPTLTRDGTITMVRLEAQPQNPASDDVKTYSCEFDSGKLETYGFSE